MLTSWSLQSTPAELSMASVLTRPPLSANSMRPRWREAEVPAFADHAAAQVDAVDAQAVVGAITDVGVRFRRRLHVRADAAVPQQVDRRSQDGRQQLVGRETSSESVPSRLPASGLIVMVFKVRG